MNTTVLPKNFSGSFWGITPFFNPQKYNNKLKNYKIFRKSNKKQGLKLITVELAFNGVDFELNKEDADILIQVRSDSIMWQKERLLNIGLGKLPNDCDKFVWLDADIIFTNNDWINETCGLLEKYATVQPFQYAVCLKKGEESIASHQPKNREKHIGKVYSLFNNHLKEAGRCPGTAWAFRKDVFKTVGFYDKIPTGGADRIICNAFCGLGIDLKQKPYNLFPYKLNKSILEWQDKITYKGIGFYYAKGYILHLYHGNKKNRLYLARHRILWNYNFDPDKDIALNEHGCWEWATNKPKLHKYLRKYFWIRNEEDKHRSIIDGYYFIECVNKCFCEIDKFIGKIGVFLKEHMPLLYLTSKNIFGLKRTVKKEKF